MSYCVNCGVELSEELKACPLCHTPVIHPGKPQPEKPPAPVFPAERGEVGAIRNDIAMLLAVVLGSTAVACAALNLLVFRQNLWSVYVAGGCAVAWVLSLPLILAKRIPAVAALLADGMVISLYCGLISWFHPGRGWYWQVALPLVWLTVLFAGIFALLFRLTRPPVLVRAAVLFGEAGVLSVLIEMIISLYGAGEIRVSWSAVVATCCAVIVVALITIICRSRLREEVRRRMHI